MDNQEYTNTLNKLGISRPYCKCCGRDITYDNTQLKITKSGLKISGKSYLTKKVVNNVEYHLHVCQECLLEKFPNIKNLSRTFNVMSESTQYAFDIPDQEYKNSRRKYALTLDSMISKYGEIEGKLRWERYCQRQRETNTFEYKHQTYGISREDFDKYNKSRSCTLKNFIAREGEINGKIHWEKYCQRQRETKTIEYMLLNKSEDEINRILNCRMTGLWNSTNSSYSKVSQLLFDKIDELILTSNPSYHTYYHNKNFEYQIHYNYSTYFLDYYIEDLKLCIEFFGDYWHANPKLYNEADSINLGGKIVNVKDIWTKDNFRQNILLDKFGIKTIIIWESDLKDLDLNTFINILLHEISN